MIGGLPTQLGKFLVIVGALTAAVWLVLMAGAKFSFFGLGKLPGDFAYRGRNFSFYFPLATCLVISLVLTVILWVISLLTRR